LQVHGWGLAVNVAVYAADWLDYDSNCRELPLGRVRADEGGYRYVQEIRNMNSPAIEDEVLVPNPGLAGALMTPEEFDAAEIPNDGIADAWK
jgi:hypothetical protein